MIRKAPRTLGHGGDPIVSVGLELATVGDQADAPPVYQSIDKPDEFSAVSDASVNLPNAITLSGYAATIGWLLGGSPLLAIYGIAADEADGRVARATGQTSDYGGLLDWAVDITLTGLVLARLGWTWLLVVVTPMQAYLRQRGFRPVIGSSRAVFTIVALLTGAPPLGATPL